MTSASIILYSATEIQSKSDCEREIDHNACQTYIGRIDYQQCESNIIKEKEAKPR